MPGMSPRIKAKKGRFNIDVGTGTPPLVAAKTIVLGISDDSFSAGYRSVLTTLDSYGTISDDTYDGNTIFYFHTKILIGAPNQVRILLQDPSGDNILPYASIKVDIDALPIGNPYVFTPVPNGNAGYYMVENNQLVDAIHDLALGSPIGSGSMVVTLGIV